MQCAWLPRYVDRLRYSARGGVVLRNWLGWWAAVAVRIPAIGAVRTRAVGVHNGYLRFFVLGRRSLVGARDEWNSFRRLRKDLGWVVMEEA
jgi:hypothetical protein